MKILDIGANNGSYAMELCKKGATQVVAVEPNPKYPSMDLSPYNILWERKAVSDVDGNLVKLYLSYADTLNSLNLDWLTKGRFANYSNNTYINVETTTIDYLWEKYKGFDHIKIDVEGYENIAIRGLTKKYDCSIQFEWATEWSHITREVMEHLSNIGYSKFNILAGEPSYDFDPFNLPNDYMSKEDILEKIPILTQKRADSWGMILAR